MPLAELRPGSPAVFWIVAVSEFPPLRVTTGQSAPALQPGPVQGVCMTGCLVVSML